MRYAKFIYEVLDDVKKAVNEELNKKKRVKDISKVLKAATAIRKVEREIKRCLRDPKIFKQVNEYRNFKALEMCVDLKTKEEWALFDHIIFTAGVKTLKLLSKRRS